MIRNPEALCVASQIIRAFHGNSETGSCQGETLYVSVEDMQVNVGLPPRTKETCERPPQSTPPPKLRPQSYCCVDILRCSSSCGAILYSLIASLLAAYGSRRDPPQTRHSGRVSQRKWLQRPRVLTNILILAIWQLPEAGLPLYHPDLRFFCCDRQELLATFIWCMSPSVTAHSFCRPHRLARAALALC